MSRAATSFSTIRSQGAALSCPATIVICRKEHLPRYCESQGLRETTSLVLYKENRWQRGAASLRSCSLRQVESRGEEKSNNTSAAQRLLREMGLIASRELAEINLVIPVLTRSRDGAVADFFARIGRLASHHAAQGGLHTLRCLVVVLPT